MSISMIDFDTAKIVFQIHGVDETGRAEIRRKLRRNDLITFSEKQVAYAWSSWKACGAAHHWARMLTGLGHSVKLIAPEAVKPFVKKRKEERRRICRRDLRNRLSTGRKVRTSQERGAAGHPGLARGSVSVGQTTDRAGQRHARPGNGIRDHRSKRHTQARRTHGGC